MGGEQEMSIQPIKRYEKFAIAVKEALKHGYTVRMYWDILNAMDELEGVE